MWLQKQKSYDRPDTINTEKMKTAYATIKGFEVTRMFKKGQMRAWQLLPGIKGEVYLIEKQFGLDSKNVYQEFWKMVNETFQAA